MASDLTAGAIWKRMWERRSEDFDSRTDVPTTDEEAHIALQREDVLLTDILRGLYYCSRVKGETVREAFRMALEDHRAAFEGVTKFQGG